MTTRTHPRMLSTTMSELNEDQLTNAVLQIHLPVDDEDAFLASAATIEALRTPLTDYTYTKMSRFLAQQNPMHHLVVPNIYPSQEKVIADLIPAVVEFATENLVPEPGTARYGEWLLSLYEVLDAKYQEVGPKAPSRPKPAETKKPAEEPKKSYNIDSIF